MPGAFGDLLSRAGRTGLEKTGPEENLNALKRTFACASDDITGKISIIEPHMKKKPEVPVPQPMLFDEGEVPLKASVALATKKTAPASAIDQDLDDDEEDMEVEERIRLQTERAFFNQTLLHNPLPGLKTPTGIGKENIAKTRGTAYVAGAGESTRRDVIFGDKLRKFIKSGKKKSLASLLMEAVKETTKQEELLTAWQYMVAVYGEAMGNMEGPARTIQIIARATRILEEQYVKYLRDRVNQNLERAEMGGVPGMKGLISAYLKSFSASSSSASGSWEMAYQALRVGEIRAASEALSSLGNVPQAAILVRALSSLNEERTLTDDIKTKLRTEWRHEERNVTDDFQKKLYAALLGLEPHGSENLEEWLWCRLTALRLDPALTEAHLTELQRKIAMDLGEAYFMPSGKTSEWFHFFSALALTGQPERAIKAIFDGMGASEAVHMAILAHETKLLTPSPVTENLLSVETAHPTHARLNMARLVGVFTKGFELEDTPRSLDYWYFLKGMETPAKGDVFEAAVSRAVYLVGEEGPALILGTRTKEGDRTPAIIDDYQVDAATVIERVASDSVVGGAYATAKRLFILANNIDRAVEVWCGVLSKAVRTGEDMEMVVEEAKKLYFLATENPGAVTSSNQSSLCMLLDMASLMRECKAGKFREATSIVRKTKVLPTEGDGLSSSLSNFHLLPSLVKELLPDLCVAVTTMAVEGQKTATDGERVQLRSLGEAVFVFSASIPHSFPAHLNSRLLLLQSQLS